jgi:hypothetical protein
MMLLRAPACDTDCQTRLGLALVDRPSVARQHLHTLRWYMEVGEQILRQTPQAEGQRRLLLQRVEWMQVTVEQLGMLPGIQGDGIRSAIQAVGDQLDWLASALETNHVTLTEWQRLRPVVRRLSHAIRLQEWERWMIR